MTEPSPINAAAGMRTFFRIMDKWSVDAKKAIAILGVSSSSYYRWVENPDQASLSQEQFERLSYVFGIYKTLQVLIPDVKIADTWVNRENTGPLFAGCRPIDYMAKGRIADLSKVRDYLDAELQR